MKDMVLYRSPLLIEGIDFHWKNLIQGTFAKFGKEINIQFIRSKNLNQGNCQKFIQLWKKDLKKRKLTLVSSTPISQAWRHICEKMQIKIYE